MEFDLRHTTIEDYQELCEWWDFWRWKDGKPSLDLLDDLKYGLMVSMDGKNICSGFIYFTNAKQFGLLEYIVSSPFEKNREIRKEALSFLIESLKGIAKRNEVTTLISYLVNDSLINKYMEAGFIIGDQNATAMICKL